MLIPPSLRKTQAVNDLPLAVAQEDVTLGGEARLTATTATEQQSSWKTLLVWGALIFGVVVLALMAWRIWREVKKAAAYKTKKARVCEPFAERMPITGWKRSRSGI